ncbi:MAG: pyruvate:ferredoxin (flavodoxin) oxidoreductase [Firmicutes bacterium]|nr:pyruvate:ferredoxin (flavodoxin) oxidoreductase [Bacillota bacterium]
MKKITIDGNLAASHVAYAFSEVAAIYPITPSSQMAEYADEWASLGRKNMFGQVLRLSELQSEAGAAGAVHGSLVSGALTTTYTASQGLLLMIPNMYKIAGELLPTVFHVSARAIATHALSIFGDHQDVMAARQTGFAMLSSNSVQEAHDMALVAHLSTLKARVPFLHFFDGFRTSHELQKIEVLDYDEMAKMVDMQTIKDFRARALNPEHPKAMGTAQNPDIYFQNREAANKFYNSTPAIVEESMAQVAKVTGRKYELFQYVGAKDAENIIVMMGSGAESAEETVNYLNKKGEKVGLIKVRLFRPFSLEHLVRAIPKTCKRIAVLDRTKEAGSLGEPLYLDVCSALFEKGMTNIKVIGGRYGLASKEFSPIHVNAVFKNLKGECRNHFTVGINDDVTKTSLDISEVIDASPEGTKSFKFYGLGSDGTVGANKESIKIIGDAMGDIFNQAYFVYDSKKAGGITISHLRFGKTPIQSTYLINNSADFVANHKQNYVTRYDMISNLKDGGVFLMNTTWSDEQFKRELPLAMKQALTKKKIKVFLVDAQKASEDAGLGKRLISTAMQACFFKVTDIIPYSQFETMAKDAIKKRFGKKGEEVVKKNIAAIDGAIKGLREFDVPQEWLTAKEGEAMFETSKDPYYQGMILPIFSLRGDELPVSTFEPCGSVPTDTTKFEKRGIAEVVPEWIKENCLQCNQCVLVCPHATIRAFLTDEKTAKVSPKDFETVKANGLDGLNYRIQVSPIDCAGCGSCANVCPSKIKSLKMVDMESAVKHEQHLWDYALTLPQIDVSKKFKKTTIKGSQFLRPYFEFEGACAGCGETPYIKLITQLFGDRLIIGNATGCSSIYGGNAPTVPYTKDQRGHGPAWANSLFEDTAEFSFGFQLAYSQRREKIAMNISKALTLKVDSKTKKAFEKYIETFNDADENKAVCDEIKVCLEDAIKETKDKELKAILAEIQDESVALVKKSIWAFGGDGWAYDIGFGGLDHILASGEDINLLVMDTEVYSNTGGQASKATPTGSIAKFAYAGKRTGKKDLGVMAMSYGNVYVAHIALGADMNQTIKAISEAESFPGPSLIIAYSTCRDHYIDMSVGQKVTKQAVECGYWPLYRFDPRRKDEGKNPFILDCKELKGSYREFLMTNGRYKNLLDVAPDMANELFEQSEKEAMEKMKFYKNMAERE